MSETFTKWWRRNRDRISRGHLSVEQAKAEIAPLTIKFCLRPGYVQSRTDGDMHYIGVSKLVRLYHLRPGQAQICHGIESLCGNLEHLHPLYSGKYFDANNPENFK